MWINVEDEPISTYGMDGKFFILCLHYHNYYGHNIKENEEVVVAVWDSTNECFYETYTDSEIDNRDIEMWWKDV